jgi:hypothetical protein
MSIWGDIGGMASDAWNGKNTDGDLAAVGVDCLHALPEVGELMPDGEEAKAAVDGAEKWAGVPDNDSGGNLGNEIGTVAGGLLGMAGGPMGAAMGMAAGSKAGGFISDLFGGDSPAPMMAPAVAPAIGGLMPTPSGPVNNNWEAGPGFIDY